MFQGCRLCTQRSLSRSGLCCSGQSDAAYARYGVHDEHRLPKRRRKSVLVLPGTLRARSQETRLIMRYFVKYSSGREIPVDVTILANGKIRADVEGRSIELDAFDHRGVVHLNMEGQSVELWMDGKVPDVGVSSADKRFYAQVENERTRALAGSSGKAGGAADKLITSPMPGRVLKVLVNEGDEIHAGKPLVVVEAMKMENELAALHDGKVKKVYVTPGTAVEGGAKLVELE